MIENFLDFHTVYAHKNQKSKLDESKIYFFSTVFSFGAGQYGQLGHNSKSDETQPRKIMELMGTEATQIGKIGKTRQSDYSVN